MVHTVAMLTVRKVSLDPGICNRRTGHCLK
jgi:hypothetical protein